MNAALREGLRLRAIRSGWEPIRIRSERRIPILDSALLWTSISRPGDASLPLGVLLGTRHGETEFHLCADTRSHDGLITFFAGISRQLEAALADSPPFLQLVLGDTADLRHLVSTTLRAGNVGPSDPWDRKQPSGSSYDPELIRQARRLGLILSHPAITRAGNTYQAAALVLTKELSEHIATAISDSERENLGIQLAYTTPGVPYWQRREQAVAAIKAPSDHRLLGSYDDNMTLALEAVGNADEGGRDSALRAYAEEVRALLNPLRALHEEAFDILRSFETGGAGAEYIREVEEKAFAAFKQHLESDRAESHYVDKRTNKKMLPNPIRHLTGRQSVKPSIGAFIRQEQFHEVDEQAMIRKDPIARAGAILDGSVVRGRVRNHDIDVKYSVLEIVTEQEIAEFEEDDEVEILDWNTLHHPNGEYATAEGTIETLMVEGAAIVYALKLRRIVSLKRGAHVQLAQKAFSSSNIFKVSQKRMTQTPWTHGDEIAPPSVARYSSSQDRVAELFGKL